VIFLYDDNDQVLYITNDGKFLGGDNIYTVINEITAKIDTTLHSDDLRFPLKQIEIIQTVKKDKSLLIIDDCFYSTDFYKTKEYFSQIKELRNYVVSKSEDIRNKKLELNIDDFSMHFIGYDAKHNSYWQGIIDKPGKIQKLAVIIYSKFGELLDAFYYGQYDDLEPNYTLYPITEALVAVSPKADVYFLVGSKEKYTLYKVENNW
jgi:hypothetical protein